MRKVTAFFVSTILVVALLLNSALPAFAAQSQKNLNSTYSINCDTSEVNVGDLYYFTLTGHNIEEMYAYDCRITFDSSKADFVIDESYSTIRNAFFYPKLALDNDSEAALIFTLLGDATPISGEKTLCVFAFRAKAPGNANFAMKHIQIVDDDLNDITLTKSHPTATIVQKAVAPPPPVVTSVSVSPAQAEVNKGDTKTFSATVNGENNPGQGVTWNVEGNSSSNTVIASDGVLSVASDETAATLTVRATSTVDALKSGTASVTVTVPPATVTSVSITPNTASVQMGETQKFSAVVNGEWNPAQTVTWSVEGESSVNTTISSDGLLSVGIDETAESLTVRATSTVDALKSGTASVVVTVPSATVTSVSVTPNTASVQMGETQKFSAVVNGEWNPAQTVTWSVEGNISANTAISEDGTLTIGFDETAKSLTIKATSTVDANKSGEATVEIIVVDYSPKVEQNKVTLNPWLTVGEVISFTETNGNKIKGAELLVPVSVDGKTIYIVSDKLSLNCVDGATSWVINNLDAEQKATEIANQTIKAKLRVSTEKGVFELPLTVVIKNVKPYIVTNQAEKFNLFYKDSEATLEIASKTDKEALTVIGTEFKSGDENPVTVIGAATDFNKETGKLTIKYANPLNPSEAYVNGKPVVRGTLYVTVEGYNWQVSKTVTIGTETSKPSYKLSSAAGALNTVLGDSKTVSFKLLDKTTSEEIKLDENAATIARLSPAEFVALEQKGSEIELTLNNTGTEEKPQYKGGTVVIAIQQSNWLAPINYTYKLTTITTKPTAKLTNSTLQLNSVFSAADAYARTDVKLNQSGVALKETAQTLYTKNEAVASALDVIYENGVITASFKEGYDYDSVSLKNGIYKFEYTPVVENGSPEGVALKTVTVSVKITDATPTVKAETVTVNRFVYRYVGKEPLRFIDSDDITVIAAAGGDAQSSLLFGASQTLASAETSRAKLIEAGKINVTFSDGEITARIKDSTVKEGSYKYTLPLRWNNGSEDVNEKGSVIVTVKVENKRTNMKPHLPEIKKKRIQIVINMFYTITRWFFG